MFLQCNRKFWETEVFLTQRLGIWGPRRWGDQAFGDIGKRGVSQHLSSHPRDGELSVQQLPWNVRPHSLWFKVGAITIKLIRQWFVASRCCWITDCPKTQWLKTASIYSDPWVLLSGVGWPPPSAWGWLATGWFTERPLPQGARWQVSENTDLHQGSELGHHRFYCILWATASHKRSSNSKGGK